MDERKRIVKRLRKIIEFSGEDEAAIRELIPNIDELYADQFGEEVARLLRTHALSEDNPLALD